MSEFRDSLNSYVFDTKLPGTGESIKLKPITTRQLKRALLYEEVEDVGKVEEALDEIITECVVTPGFDVEKIYLQDRFFILLELRKVTKGNSYIFQAICNECSGQFMQTVNLSELPVKYYKKARQPELTKVQKEIVKKIPTKKKKNTPIIVVEDAPVTEDIVTEHISENSDVVVLNDTLTVEPGMITRGMQKDAFKLVENLPALSNIQKKMEAVSVMQAQSIIAATVSGKRFYNLSLEDKLYMLDNTTQMEMDKLLKWYDDNDFGVDFSFTQKCPHCKAETRREVPMEDFFF
jgi:hypothetical protein